MKPNKNKKPIPAKVKKTVVPPTQKEIIFCISLYVAIRPKFSRSDILYKPHLQEIVNARSFYNKVAKEDLPIFREYIQTRQSKLIISKKYFDGHTSKGGNLINKYLLQLVQEIMQDYENGLLTVREYQKPILKGSRAYNKRINELAEKMGLNIRVPLRKKSTKEILKDWRQYSKEIEEKINGSGKAQ